MTSGLKVNQSQSYFPPHKQSVYSLLFCPRQVLLCSSLASGYDDKYSALVPRFVMNFFDKHGPTFLTEKAILTMNKVTFAWCLKSNQMKNESNRPRPKIRDEEINMNEV